MFYLFIILFFMIPLTVAGIQLFVGKRHADQTAVLWTLAIALDKQLPLAEELDAVADTLSKRHAAKTRRLVEHLWAGDSLSKALAGVPGVIPRVAILTAQINEQNDALPTAMRDAAVRHAKSGPGGSGGFSAVSLMYPLAILHLTVLIFSFLMYFIIPKFKKIFDDFGSEMPELTVDVIQFSDVMVQFSFLPILIIGLPLVLGTWAVDAYCRGWGESDVPLVGRWFRRLDVPGILRNLAMTVTADRPIDDALLLISRVHRGKAVRSATKLAYETSRQGDDCWYALRDAGLINVREVAVLRSAQRVGNLPWALQQLAETIERRISHRWLTILEFVQPLVVLVMGVIIGVLVLSLFIPLISLLNELS